MPLQPRTQMLSQELVDRILDEAFQLMMRPGIKVRSAEARALLAEAGAETSSDEEVVRIPEKTVRKALETVPASFDLYDRFELPSVHYGEDAVHFDPGSSAVHVMDPETLEHRASESRDLVRIVKIAEMLPQYDAQSTAVVCNDVPKEIGDLYRLYLVLLYSSKPIVTGAFSVQTIDKMVDMLAMFAGGREQLRRKPQAVFDACPNPPLIWGEFGSANLVMLARAGVPVEMVSMPLAGAVSPVTLLGTVTQHAAECLAGIAIHQAACPGAPIVWGGAPAIFDMRKGSTPMAAIETAMIDSSYAQVGKFLNIPTHTYLCTSDAKVVDAQAGLESGMTALIGALSGINMISGAGMLDFLSCLSPEKLVIDAEAIAMTRRLLDGMKVHTETLATALFEGINFKGDFLKQRATRDLFMKEQHLPSSVIDRDSVRGWQASGGLDAFARARIRTEQLISSYRQPEMDASLLKALTGMVDSLAAEAGMSGLPVIQ